MKQVPYISILLVLLFASNSIAQPVQDENLPNGFLVKFKPDINPEAIRAKNILQADYGMREGEYFKYLDIWYIEYEPAKISKEEALQTLRDDPAVLRSNPIRKVDYRAAIPNDDDFGDQWALSNTGQTGGTSGADISALQAWEITKGNPWGTHEPILAVVDGGFQLVTNVLVRNAFRKLLLPFFLAVSATLGCTIHTFFPATKSSSFRL